MLLPAILDLSAGFPAAQVVQAVAQKDMHLVSALQMAPGMGNPLRQEIPRVVVILFVAKAEMGRRRRRTLREQAQVAADATRLEQRPETAAMEILKSGTLEHKQ